MTRKRYKLTAAAKWLGLNAWTLRRWVYAGKAPSLKTDPGRVFMPAWWVEEQTGENPPSWNSRCARYVRAASPANKAAMASPAAGLRNYAQAKGYQIVHLVSEFGSGLGDNRPKLPALLKKRDFEVLLVAPKDRVTRFGVRWFETLCPFQIEVVNIAENSVNDLREDLIAILTALATRLYGQRTGRQKTEAAIKALEETQ